MTKAFVPAGVIINCRGLMGPTLKPAVRAKLALASGGQMLLVLVNEAVTTSTPLLSTSSMPEPSGNGAMRCGAAGRETRADVWWLQVKRAVVPDAAPPARNPSAPEFRKAASAAGAGSE